MARRYFRNGPLTTLAASIGGSDTSIQVADASGFPVLFPYTLILDYEESVEEVVEVSAAASNTLTVTRGVDSTTAFPHSAGAVVAHGTSARDANEASLHINSSSGVHGVTGDLVGLTDAQTLTNKTLTSPTVNTPVVSSPTITGGTATSMTLNGATIDGATIDGATIRDGVLGPDPGNADPALSIVDESSVEVGTVARDGGLTVPTAVVELNSAASVGLTIKRAASQTGDLLRILDSDGATVLYAIDASGYRDPEAWTNASLSVNRQARDGLTPRFRRVDQWVEMDGAIEPSPPGEMPAGGGYTLFTLPAGYRPARQVRVAVAVSLSGEGISGAGRLDIHTSGLVELWSQTLPIWTSISCRFPLD